MRPHIAEMRSEEPVEFWFKIGIEIIAVPPEPVAAFRGLQFLPSRLCAVGRKTRGNIHKPTTGMTEEIPSAIVFLVPDPDFIVGVDPGA